MSLQPVFVVIVLSLLIAIVAFAIVRLIGEARRRRPTASTPADDVAVAVALLVAMNAASTAASSASSVDCASSASHC